MIWLELLDGVFVNLNLHPGVTGISLWLQSNLIIRRRMRSIKMNWYMNERDILEFYSFDNIPLKVRIKRESNWTIHKPNCVTDQR